MYQSQSMDYCDTMALRANMDMQMMTGRAPPVTAAAMSNGDPNTLGAGASSAGKRSSKSRKAMGSYLLAGRNRPEPRMTPTDMALKGQAFHTSDVKISRSGPYMVLGEQKPKSRPNRHQGGNHRAHTTLKYIADPTKRRDKAEKTTRALEKMIRAHCIQTGQHALLLMMKHDGSMRAFHHGCPEDMYERYMQSRELNSMPPEDRAPMSLAYPLAGVLREHNIAFYSPPLDQINAKVMPDLARLFAANGSWGVKFWLSKVQSLTGPQNVCLDDFTVDDIDATLTSSEMLRIQRFESQLANDEQVEELPEHLKRRMISGPQCRTSQDIFRMLNPSTDGMNVVPEPC
jgi:hypothetical protein